MEDNKDVIKIKRKKSDYLLFVMPVIYIVDVRLTHVIALEYRIIDKFLGRPAGDPDGFAVKLYIQRYDLTVATE